MAKSDWEYFNCSQVHEINYVVSLYSPTDQPAVKKWIVTNCNNGTINNWTHGQLYSALANAGYTK